MMGLYYQKNNLTLNPKNIFLLQGFLTSLFNPHKLLHSYRVSPYFLDIVGINIIVQQCMQGPVVFKIIVLGQQGVGKSSMLIRYMKGEFSGQYNVTVGVEFASRSVRVESGHDVKLQIWDTAGQEAFRAIVRSFYKGIAAVFLSFALDKPESLEALRVWIREVKDNGHEQIVFFLVGTRADLVNERKVSTEMANQFLKEFGAAFYIQTSAKTGQNIDQLFEKSANVMYKKYMTNQAFRLLVTPSLTETERKREASFALTENRMTLEGKKKKCCL